MLINCSFDGEEFCERLHKIAETVKAEVVTEKCARYQVYTWMAQMYRTRTGNKRAKLSWPGEVKFPEINSVCMTFDVCFDLLSKYLLCCAAGH